MNIIDQFEAFVDFISNVDKQKATIAQLKEATKQYGDALASLTKGQSLAAWEKTLQSKQDKLTSDTASSQKVLDTQSNQLSERAKELDEKEVELGKLTQKQIELTNSANAFMAVVTAKQVDVDKKTTDLNVQIAKYNQLAADLAAKQEALSKVFK